MLKDAKHIEKELASLYEREWAAAVCAPDPDSWPKHVSVGSPSKHDLESDFSAFHAQIDKLQRWTCGHGLELEYRRCNVSGTMQQLPSHVVANSIEDVARAAGSAYVRRLTVARRRADALASRFDLDEQTLEKVLRLMDSTMPAEAFAPNGHAAPGSRTASDGHAAPGTADLATDTDFDLVCDASLWFTSYEARGLTARQVPLEGFHAKWLDAGVHRRLIELLSDKDDLGLVERPQQVDFTYLDPDYLAGGGRRHDSAVEGDVSSPAYQPRIVVISENKDTALMFPALSGGIAVEGGGWKGASLIGRFAWVTRAERVVYWGDMDAAGLEILNGYRADGLDVTSMFMDLPSYERYERFGTFVDARGAALPARARRDLPYLTDGERELYDCLVASGWTRPRRIEQERIPLSDALEAVVRSFAR